MHEVSVLPLLYEPDWQSPLPSERSQSRQPNGEGRARAGLARYRDVAAHHLTEAPANHEAKAGAKPSCTRTHSRVGRFASVMNAGADGFVDRKILSSQRQ